ncbi:hypothetical protein I4U23_005080 [Adineta vaga]|nr:hypothetical protein I4U23_005080 [Adineta vaga]
MSSLNTSIAAINYSNSVFYQFWSYLLFCLGIVGHSLNFYVFTRPTLRSNPCVRYFLASTISGLLVTLINVLLRLLQLMYKINTFGYSTVSCKILTFIVYCTKAQASWFIVLASIDRFLCSSPSTTVRAWSNLRVSCRSILCMPIIMGTFYIYVPIQFENIQTITRCPASQSVYPLFNGMWGLLIFSLGPSIIILIFGSLTIRHVQQTVRKTVPMKILTNNQTESRSLPQEQWRIRKSTDRQLIQMMIGQCIYYSLMSTPISVFWIYSSLRINVVPDALQLAKDTLFANITGALSLTGACTSFYCFTLSSQLFRKELMHLFHILRLRLNQINNP